MLELKKVTAGYPGKNVLFDISLSVPAGQITVLLGPNGCGKSTLLKTICGILPISSGKLFLQKENICDLSAQMLARRVSYLAQNHQVPDLTVERLVLFGRFPYLHYPRRYRAVDHQIARQAMAQMKLLDLAEAPMSTLSGGTRQKAYIAMALAQDTPIILFDEPTAYLDISHQLQMAEHARFLSRKKKTVVMVLHDIPMALTLADRIAVMENGRIVMQGSPESVWSCGCLDRVFGVSIRRMQTPDGWQYYVTHAT